MTPLRAVAPDQASLDELLESKLDGEVALPFRAEDIGGELVAILRGSGGSPTSWPTRVLRQPVPGLGSCGLAGAVGRSRRNSARQIAVSLAYRTASTATRSTQSGRRDEAWHPRTAEGMGCPRKAVP
jgi:hypothetical protein